MNRNKCLMLGLIVLVLTFAGPASAQQAYQTLPVNPAFDIFQIKKNNGNDQKKAEVVLRKLMTQQTSAARSVMRSRDGVMPPAFQKYYKEVVTPLFTRYDAESLSTLTKRREEIIRDINRCNTNQVRGFLVAQVFYPEMIKIIDGDFHPAVRYNALVLVGELDQVPGKSGTTAPRPFTQSITFLLDHFNKQVDPKLAYLKYGAFKGISRAAGIDSQLQAGFFTPDQRNQVKAIYRSMLGAKPANLSADLFAAMQRKAVEIMGNYGDPSDGDAFAKLIDDPTVSKWTKLEASVAYSKLKTPPAAVAAQSAKSEPVVRSIGKFMHDVLREESDYLDYHQKRIAILAVRKKEIAQGSTSGSGMGWRYGWRYGRWTTGRTFRRW